MIKQHVVRAILRDFFRIMSHGIYFSSHAILKTSDEILFSSEKFGEMSEKIKKKVGEFREKFENTSQICRRNDFEPTWKTLVFS